MAFFRKFMLFSLKMFYFSLRWGGVLSFSYSRGKSKLIESTWAKVYCGSTACSAAIFGVYYVKSVLAAINSDEMSSLVDFVYSTRLLAYYSVYCLTIQMQFWNGRALMDASNELISLFGLVQSLDHQHTNIFGRNFFIRITCKMLLVTAQYAIHVYQTLTIQTNTLYGSLETSYLAVMFAIVSGLTNAVYCGLTLALIMFRAINANAKKRLKEVQSLPGINYMQKFKCAEISKDVEYAVQIHCRLLRVVAQFVAFFQWQILIMMCNAMANIVTKIFSYFAVTSGRLTILSFLLLFLELIDLLLLILSCDLYEEATVCIKEVFASMMILRYYDTRIEQTERYKTDINLAIQLLQCKPDSFVPQKVSSLPVEIQSKVSTYMRLETNSHSDSEGSTSGVGLATPGSYKVLPVSDSPPPICPFPPTAMVYSMRGLDAARNNSDCNGKGDQMISPSAMAKYLQDELKASEIKHCDTCNCSPKDLTVLIDEPKTYNVGTQTIVQSESGNSLCLRCNSNLNSPSRTNSPYIMKIVKSSDSVISETKSSVSDLLDNEKLFTPAKKDDLMVNPILGHHRLCDRTVSKQQQQQICDTAKYIVETKKLENEIADLRKFNDKSPILSLGSELCSTFSKSIAAPVGIKLVDSSNDVRQNGSAALIADNGNNDNEMVEMIAENINLQHQQVQGTCTNVESDTSDIAGNKKLENNLQQENNSQQGSNDKSMNKVGNTITGSTNSLWSKSSSSEGAKIFENFNRNLIKTIKAENPLHRGPRLCALRIQNGSNNILLDNIDSEIMPIVYTRPARFLDEELDDSKDIITSKISMLMSKRNSFSTTSSQVNSTAGARALPSTSQQHILDTNLGAESVDPENEASTSVCAGNGEINIRQANLDSNSYCDVIQSVLNANSLESSTMNQQNQPSLTPHLVEQQSDSIVFDANLDNHTINRIANIELENSREHLLAAFRNSPLRHSSGCPDQQQNWNGIVLDFQRNPESKQHYEVLMLGGDNSLNSSIKNTTNKSGTQSSSVSSSGADIDVQETAFLRRQQLTRVAEWVQNNTQQQDLEVKPTTSTHYCNSSHLLASNPDCTTISQTSQSRNSNNSIEKFSISDSTSCRAARPSLLNGMQHSLNNNQYQIHSNSSQPQLQLTKPRDINSLINNCQNVQESIAQNNYPSLYHDPGLKFKVPGADSADKPILMQPRCSESMREMLSNSQENQNVDLAQMEYNVKQFLLKQSEWSICNVNRSLNSSSPTNTITSPDKASAALPTTSGNKNLKSCYERKTIAKNHSLPLRTETNL